MNDIPVAKPYLGEAEIDAAAKTIRSGWITQGPRVEAFEAALAKYVGAPHACAVSNCTAALQLALRAVGVRAGDVVITVSHSFIATANAVRACQAEPYFVDIDTQSLNLDPDRLVETLRREFHWRDGQLWLRQVARLQQGESPLCYCAPPLGRLAAILVVHQLGFAADMRRLVPIARDYGVPIVEDAACAIGSALSLDCGATWEFVGRPHGDIACFSFHPRKMLTTGDGGMLTTARDVFDRCFRLWRQHGMSVSDAARHRATQVVFEQYRETGFNYRMTDLQAAIGQVQLERLPDFPQRRRELVAAYHAALCDVPGIRLPVEPPHARTNWQTYQVHVADPAWQRPIMVALRQQGIHSRRGVMCAHLELPYTAAWPRGTLPNSERSHQTGIVLPLFHEMTPVAIRRVAHCLRKTMTTLLPTPGTSRGQAA